MILSFLFSKLKLLLFVFINIFKRAFFCGKRTSNCDVIPLTHVISNIEEYAPEWGNWGEEQIKGTENDSQTLHEPKKNVFMKQALDSTDTEEHMKFFDDMTPNITKQLKVFVNNDNITNLKSVSTNRLNLMADNVSF